MTGPDVAKGAEGKDHETKDRLDRNWALLREITTNMSVMKGQTSRESAAMHEESVGYIQLLNDLRHDRIINGVTYLGMYRAPGSKNRHHDVEGGLVAHLLQMWALWVDLRQIFREHKGFHPLLTDSNVWKCILHHDLNKVWKYKLVETEDKSWAVDYSDEPLGELLGDDVHKVIFFLNQRGIKLTVPLYNALITAEGGYSRQPRPKADSVLAKVAYLLDDMSANIIDRLQNNRFWDSKRGGISEIP